VIDRKGQKIDTTMTPVLSSEEIPILGPDLEPTPEKAKQYVMRAGYATAEVRLGFSEALSEAVSTPIEAATGLIRVFTRPSTFKDNVGGPGTMFTATQNAVRLGVPSVLLLSALLSISVGIFNLLPAPPLDGGQMAIALAEMFRGGRRLSMKVQMTLGTMGMAFVFLLVMSALTVDVMRHFEKKEPPLELVKSAPTK
jgi:membrane-associated protease RseP (regulator of RpoE activity)